jgi:hypothetical protein
VNSKTTVVCGSEYRILRENKNVFKTSQMKPVTLRGTQINEYIKNLYDVNKMIDDIKECQKWRNRVFRMLSVDCQKEWSSTDLEESGI